jgi:outer membrane protein TolC
MKVRLLSVLLVWSLASQAAGDEISQYRRGWYHSPSVGAVTFTDTPRIDSLIRAGNLYLSLQDAIALAIENNLDVEFQRLNTPIAQTDTLRARGGGSLRGIDTSVTEVPAGIGGPSAPILTAAASGSTPSTALPGYSSDLTIITEQPTNNSVLTQFPYSSGPPIPAFDPSINGTLGYEHQNTPQASTLTSGYPTLVQDTLTGNLGYNQSFSPGTQISAGFNNSWNSLTTTRNNYNPYTMSSLGVTVTQPLLRGFGIALNRRFIRIAKNDEKITDLVFKEQLISTVSGVIRLYQDLVALNEDVTNRRETLALAQRLYEDNKNKVDAGTLAPVEQTRAQAQVAAARQDLINAEGFVAQQELIVKSVLTKRFSADPLVRAAHIVPTDTIDVAASTPMPKLDDLLAEANTNRPDLLYAGVQIDNSKISLEGSRNELLPELDLVGTAQNSGLAGSLNPNYQPLSGSTPAPDPFLGNYGDTLAQIARFNYPTYEVGINLTLPLRNRVAQADVIRDELQVRQSEINRQRLINLVRLEVEDAVVALDRSRAAYEAAVEARKLQEESLTIEQERYAVGLSTTFLVLQYQSFLAQARSTEIAAKSTYAKARTALDRAVGVTLDRNNVSVSSAYARRVR